MLKRLQERRKQLMTQAELAARLGVQVVTISRIETAWCGVSFDLAIRISNEIGYDIDPTGVVSEAFKDIMDSSLSAVIHAAKTFNVAFDPDNLFEVIK